MERAMKFVVFAIAAVMLLCIPAQAQESNLYFAGAAYTQGGDHPITGSALWAHSINANGTAAFTAIDIIPASVKPFTFTTNIGVGISQRIATIDGVSIYVPTSAGISFTGNNTGFGWATGLGAPVKIKAGKDGWTWYAMPTLRVAKSTVSGGSGYQPIFGVLFGGGS